jgi:addiction module HigA family antidote
MTNKAIDLLKQAYDVIEVCKDSNYGRAWLWPETAHESAMNEVKECLTAIQSFLDSPESKLTPLDIMKRGIRVGSSRCGFKVVSEEWARNALVQLIQEQIPSPVTPGEILLEEFLKPMGLDYIQLSKEINIHPAIISNILINKTRITANICLRLSKYFGTSKGYWLRLQNEYDLEVARRSNYKALNEIKPFSTKSN